MERVRRGRPPLTKSGKLANTNFRAPQGMLDAFTSLAAELGATRSELYRGAFSDYLKRAKVEWEK